MLTQEKIIYVFNKSDPLQKNTDTKEYAEKETSTLDDERQKLHFCG